MKRYVICKDCGEQFDLKQTDLEIGDPILCDDCRYWREQAKKEQEEETKNHNTNGETTITGHSGFVQ